MNSWFNDDLEDYKTMTLLGSKQPTELEKQIIFRVLKFVSQRFKPTRPEFHQLLLESNSYDDLKSKIKDCKTNECLLMHAGITYGLESKHLLMDTIAIHSRIKHLDSKEAWFDNFSLNSFLLQLTTVVYDKYDNSDDNFVKSIPMPSKTNFINKPALTGGKFEKTEFINLLGGDEVENIRDTTYSLIYGDDMIETEIKQLSDELDEIYEKSLNATEISGGISENDYITLDTQIGGSNENIFINYDKQISHPKELLFHLGNEYRIFTNFGKISEDVTNSEALEMLDKLNEKYPYYTGCTHGCDVFTPMFKLKSVSIEDIKEFTDRYPLSIVGYILNTKTYKSGKGQHWVAMIFKNGKCYLICSQANNFNCFEEKTLLNDLTNAHFEMFHNPDSIQKDSCNCGLFSALANLSFLINCNGFTEPNIKTVVDYIGVNAKNINENGIFVIKKVLAGWNSE